MPTNFVQWFDDDKVAIVACKLHSCEPDKDASKLDMVRPVVAIHKFQQVQTMYEQVHALLELRF